MDLKVLFVVLWRKKWILILVPFFCICCALAIRVLGEWRFKSSAQLATGLTLSDEIVENSKLNPYEVQVTFNNLIEIIKSRLVLGQVSYRLLEHDLFDSLSAFRRPDPKEIEENTYLFEQISGNVKDDPIELKTILRQKIATQTLLDPNRIEEKRLKLFIEAYGYDYESINKDLTVNRIDQSDFIELTFLSENPALSAFVVNTVCSEFIRYYSTIKMGRANLSLQSLQSIATQRNEFLDRKREELTNFKSRNNVINSVVDSEDKIRQIRDYEEQIANERQNIRGLELTLANLNLRIHDAETSPDKKTSDQIVELRRQINDVNEKYVQSGQSDIKYADTLSALRNELNTTLRVANEHPKLNSAEINILRNRREESRVALEIARANLNSLMKIHASLRSSMGSFADMEAKIRALEKEVEVASQEYLVAQNRYSEAKGKLVTGSTSINQILMAEPAAKAESGKTLLFMIFSGALGFIVSAFAIIAIELSDPRIKTTQRFRQLTRMKLAGMMPKVRKPVIREDLFVTDARSHTHKRINEELRKIRYEIDVCNAGVILVTSLKNGQGKSFFIIALAYSLSLLKKRTLIIDTNLRNNSLTKLLLAKTTSKLLLENFEQSLKLLGADANGETNGRNNFDHDLITKTKNNFIDIIGNKKSQMSPSEVIPGGDFKVLLAWLKIHYDFIILEGPALNLFSDTKELSGFVDLVIPVFSADSKIDVEDWESLNFLKSLQQKLGPAVLNNVQSFS
jgi:succinoglycan biosynthesis transport protein ExoP